MTASGNLGRDPELKNVNGTDLAKFSIGCRTGQDETTWINCDVWGKRASVVMEYMKKGNRVTVAGSAKVVEFESNDGTPGKALEMNVSDFTLPEKGADAAPSAPTPKQTRDQSQQWKTAPLVPDTDDIPF